MREGQDIIQSYINNNFSHIFICEEITSSLAGRIIQQVLSIKKHWDDNFISANERKIILYLIDCPGGSVSASDAIADTIKQLCREFTTVAAGLCASAAAKLLTEGKQRIAFPNTEIMIHQPLGTASGQATDILIQSERVQKVRTRLYKDLAKRTGQAYEKIADDCERDRYFTAEEALQYGLITNIYRPGEDELP